MSKVSHGATILSVRSVNGRMHRFFVSRELPAQHLLDTRTAPAGDRFRDSARGDGAVGADHACRPPRHWPAPQVRRFAVQCPGRVEVGPHPLHGVVALAGAARAILDLQVDPAVHGRQRSAQLMAVVGDEAARPVLSAFSGVERVRDHRVPARLPGIVPAAGRCNGTGTITDINYPAVKVSLRRGQGEDARQLLLAHPRRAKNVSFRAEAADRAGNTVQQTVIRVRPEVIPGEGRTAPGITSLPEGGTRTVGPRTTTTCR